MNTEVTHNNEIIFDQRWQHLENHERLYDELLQSIEAQLSQNTTLWLMIDPSVRDPLDNPTFAAHFMDAHKNDEKDYLRLHINHEKILNSHSPYLVSIDLNDEGQRALFEASVKAHWLNWSDIAREHFLGQNICGWFMTKAPKAALKSHLELLTLQTQSTTKKQYFFRYYDPQVLEDIWQLSSLEQRQQLMGNIECWYHINRKKELVLYSNPLAADFMLQPNLDLRLDQYQTLILAHARNYFLARFFKQNQRWLTQDEELNLYKLFYTANSLNIKDAHNLVIFAEHGFNVHDKFYQHKSLAEHLKIHLRNTSYELATAKISEADWQKIKLDCEAMK